MSKPIGRPSEPVKRIIDGFGEGAAAIKKRHPEFTGHKPASKKKRPSKK